MRQWWTPLTIVGPLALAAACGDPTEAEPTPRLRTVVVHAEPGGENLLLDTDGTLAGALDETTGMIPVGAHVREGAIAFLNGTALILITQLDPTRVDTILNPAPPSMSLVAFSEDGALLALVSYAPTRGVLVYDRVNARWDTLPVGTVDPVLPPAFSPDGTRLALVGLTEISLLITLVGREAPSQTVTQRLSVSRFVNRPIFGWPRWLDDGLRMAFRRVATDGPDTLLVGLVQPDAPETLLEELYRAVLAPGDGTVPGLTFGPSSTYALAPDGEAVVVGAEPEGDTSRHAIYLVTPGIAHVQSLLNDPARYPLFPLFIRE